MFAVGCILPTGAAPPADWAFGGLRALMDCIWEFAAKQTGDMHKCFRWMTTVQHERSRDDRSRKGGPVWRGPLRCVLCECAGAAPPRVFTSAHDDRKTPPARRGRGGADTAWGADASRGDDASHGTGRQRLVANPRAGRRQLEREPARSRRARQHRRLLEQDGGTGHQRARQRDAVHGNRGQAAPAAPPLSLAGAGRVVSAGRRGALGGRRVEPPRQAAGAGHGARAGVRDVPGLAVGLLEPRDGPQLDAARHPDHALHEDGRATGSRGT